MSDQVEVDPSTILSIGTPWFSGDAVEWLEHNLWPSDVVVEFGGGRSTTFFLSRCRSVTTFETSPSWTVGLMQYLMGHPALYRKWRLQHLPVDWSPNWDNRSAGYWGEHEGSLNYATAREMERAYLLSALRVDGSVLVIDGGLRSHLFVLFAELGLFANYQLVIIDNTEQKFPGLYFEANPLLGFQRLDFVAGSFDGDVLELTEGRQITSVFVRDDRLSELNPAETEHPYRWQPDELVVHEAFERDEETLAEAESWGIRVKGELIAYGLLPPEDDAVGRPAAIETPDEPELADSGAELPPLAEPVAEVVLES